LLKTLTNVDEKREKKQQMCTFVLFVCQMKTHEERSRESPHTMEKRANAKEVSATVEMPAPLSSGQFSSSIG
jgi:hypothetical protein